MELLPPTAADACGAQSAARLRASGPAAAPDWLQMLQRCRALYRCVIGDWRTYRHADPFAADGWGTYTHLTYAIVRRLCTTAVSGSYLPEGIGKNTNNPGPPFAHERQCFPPVVWPNPASVN